MIHWSCPPFCLVRYLQCCIAALVHGGISEIQSFMRTRAGIVDSGRALGRCESGRRMQRITAGLYLLSYGVDLLANIHVVNIHVVNIHVVNIHVVNIHIVNTCSKYTCS